MNDRLFRLPVIGKRLKKILASPQYRTILENFASLSVLQIANYLLPVITLPYLVRILGPERFGLIAFARAFAQYFVILTDYGFNLSAVREISVNRSDEEKVCRIFSTVMVIKSGLTLICFLLMTAFVCYLPKFSPEKAVYFLTFGMVIGNVLFPVWFFQGMEKMKYITALNILSKAIFTVSIFIFVKKASHYPYVPLIHSLGFITAGVVGLWLVRKDFRIRFILPGLEDIKHQLREGWRIFISKVSINLYTTSNAFLLGLFTNNIVVGYYAAAERIIRVLTSLFNPIWQAIYPFIANLASASQEQTVRFLRKLTRYTLVVTGAGFVLLLVVSEKLVILVLGRDFFPSILPFRIFSPLIFIIPLASIFAHLALLPFRLDRYFVRIYVSGAFINLVSLVVLVGLLNLQAEGAALANLLVESILTVMMFVALNKSRIRLLTS